MSSDKTAGLLSTYQFPVELRVEELVVRPPGHDDVDRIAPAFLDPDVGGEAGLPPFDADTLHATIDAQLPAMRESGMMAPYLIEELASGAIFGGCALHHLDRMRDVVEIGYWLFASARGRGVATRVVEALCEHAFAGGIYRVEAVVRPANTASARVLERAGFRAEGVRRGVLRHDGKRADATLYARLADD